MQTNLMFAISYLRKTFVRSGIRTHAHIRGPEHSLRHKFAEKVTLESGALDRSAILTTDKLLA